MNFRPPYFTETENETDDKIALRESLVNLALGLMPPAALLMSSVMAFVMTIHPQLANNDKAWDFARNLFVGGAFGGVARKIASSASRDDGPHHNDGFTPYSPPSPYSPLPPNYPNISPDAPAVEQSEPRAAGFKFEPIDTDGIVPIEELRDAALKIENYRGSGRIK